MKEEQEEEKATMIASDYVWAVSGIWYKKNYQHTKPVN